MGLSAAQSSMPAAIIPLDAHRPARRIGIEPPQIMKAAVVFAVCLLGLVGSFADSAVARTGLLLIGTPDDLDGGKFASVAAILVWATVANIAACAGVLLIGYWLVSRPSAEVVELRPRRRNR